MRGVAQIATLVALVALPLPVRAQNLLVNPDFDTDLAGWQTDVDWIDASFDAEDYAGAAESGSARVVNTRDVAGTDGLAQCVAIAEADGATAYDMTVRTRVGAGQGLNGGSELELSFLVNDGCDFTENGSLLGSTSRFNSLDAWNEIGVEGLVAPAGTRSVLFNLSVLKIIMGGSYEARFDHAYLPEPRGAAFAAVAALLALRRRR